MLPIDTAARERAMRVVGLRGEYPLFDDQVSDFAASRIGRHAAAEAKKELVGSIRPGEITAARRDGQIVIQAGVFYDWLGEEIPLRPEWGRGEVGWYDKNSALCLIGRLDACVRTDIGFFAPVDHKTKGAAPSVVEDRYLLQLDTYELLLEENGYPPAGVGYLDFYIPSGRLDSGLSLDVVVLEAETSADRAREWLLQARSVLDQGELPKPTPDCEHCLWAAARQHTGYEF